MKQCSKCEKTKQLSEFCRDKNSKDGLSYWCKLCSNKNSREYRVRNKEKIINQTKVYREKNKDILKEKRKKYYRQNKDIELENNKTYRKNNPDMIRNKNNRYYKKAMSNPIRKIAFNLRSRLYQAIKRNYKAGSAVRDLGCNIGFLKWHLEAQFQPGMTWDNYGKWHIDHIKPLSSFDLTDRKQLLEACHYTNLQPLWAYDNLSKGAKK